MKIVLFIVAAIIVAFAGLYMFPRNAATPKVDADSVAKDQINTARRG